MSKFPIGTIVVPAPDAGWPSKVKGKRYVITEVPGGRRTRYKAQPCDANGKVVAGSGLAAPEYAIVALSDSEEGAVVTEYVPNPAVGTLVRVKDEHRVRYDSGDDVFVVFGETDHERVRITRIGGDSGRYWKAFSRHLAPLDSGDAQSALRYV